MTEAQLRAEVFALCERLGLEVLYIPDSRRLEHGKGYPDLTIVGQHHMLFAELKTAEAKLSREQIRWRYLLLAAGQRVLTWRPVHLWSGEIETELARIK